MTTRNLILVFAATTLFAQCKKYEDDPSIQLVPREVRLTNTWEFQAAYIDNENINEQYQRYDLTIREDGTAYLDAEYQPFPSTIVNVETNGTWTLKDNDETIDFDYDNDAEDGSYTIKRLTLKEFRIKDQNGDKREIFLRNK